MQRQKLSIVRSQLNNLVSTDQKLSDLKVCKQALPIAELTSYQAGQDGILLNGLQAFMGQLETGEGLDFVHNFVDGVEKNYSLKLGLMAHVRRQAELAKRIQQLCPCLFPYHGWSNLANSIGVSKDCEKSVHVLRDLSGESSLSGKQNLEFSYVLNPKGFKAQRLPTSTGYIQSGNQSAMKKQRTINTYTALHGQPSIDMALLPSPQHFPNWALTTPFDDFIEPNAAIRITAGFRKKELTAAQQTQLHSVLRKLESGNFSLFEPNAIVSPYSASPHLVKEMLRLLRDWLRYPQGLSYRCKVESSVALTDLQVDQIGCDFFGKQAFSISDSSHTAASVNLSSYDIDNDNFLDLGAWAKLSQGLPAFMTSSNILQKSGFARHYAPATVLPVQQGHFVGTLLSGRTAHPVCLEPSSRSSHTMITGASGTGKSNLICQLIEQDMADGYGLMLIDPHGDLIADVLRLVPDNRADDVLLIDIESKEYAASINPMAGMKNNALQAQFVVNEVIAMFEQVVENSDTSGPMGRAYLKQTMLLAAHVPLRDATFLDCLRIVEDTDYRDYLLSKCKDKEIHRFWATATATRSDTTGLREWLPYLSARFNILTQNPVMKRLLCCPTSTLDISACLESKKIVLFKLSKSVLQEQEVQMLGTTLLMQIYAAAMKRAALSPSLRVPFSLYIDEMQTFANASFPRLLAETRKMNLGLTMAFQNLRQLAVSGGSAHTSSQVLLDAVLANTANKFVFRSAAPSDLEALASVYKPVFESAHVATLANFTAIAQLMKNNTLLPAVAVAIAPPKPSLACDSVSRLLSESAQRRCGQTIHEANLLLNNTYDLEC
jgi:Helicase HerA, central domain